MLKCSGLDRIPDGVQCEAVQNQPKNKGGRPRKAPILREGKAGTDAFVTAMRQILNPLPEKKHR